MRLQITHKWMLNHVAMVKSCCNGLITKCWKKWSSNVILVIKKCSGDNETSKQVLFEYNIKS